MIVTSLVHLPKSFGLWCDKQKVDWLSWTQWKAWILFCNQLQYQGFSCNYLKLMQCFCHWPILKLARITWFFYNSKSNSDSSFVSSFLLVSRFSIYFGQRFLSHLSCQCSEPTQKCTIKTGWKGLGCRMVEWY